MRERKKGKTQSQAAVTANLKDRRTVAKYQRSGRLPSEMKRVRTYRTREDPFAADWAFVVEKLTAAPELEAKALFEWLCKERPGRYQAGQMRTFQRRVRVWRGEHKAQVATLDQVRVAGEMMQMDGTWMSSLEVTIGGVAFPHLLIHCVLPYSNWSWGRVAQSESLAALTMGLESALTELGHVPERVQTDNSSAATRRLGADEADEGTGRTMTDGWTAVCEQHGIKPQATHVGNPNENGDVESANGALKRSVKQALLLRGSRDFETIGAYETFLQGVMRQRNRTRQARLNEEMAVMKPFVPTAVTRRVVKVKVNSASLIRVLRKPYSMPTSLIGRTVTVQIGEWQLDVFYAGKHIETLPRLGENERFYVNYRHVIGSLLRKPGGFRRYRYRTALFPRLVFQRAWEQLDKWHTPHRADVTYLSILNLAATVSEEEVAVALELLLESGERFNRETVELLLKTADEPHPIVTTLQPFSIDTTQWDCLIPNLTTNQKTNKGGENVPA